MSSGKIITVFGNGRIPNTDPQYAQAYELGKLLGAKGHGVCNGGYGGIMEASAKGAKEMGVKTVGITSKEAHGWANPWVTEERQVSGWKERLFSLIETGEGYVLFDGGTGTMTELFVIWEMTNKKLLQKNIVLMGPQLIALVDSLKNNPAYVFTEFLKTAKTPQEAAAFY